MPYNSNTLFQKMPDKVSFFYAQMFLYQKLILVMNMLKMIIEDNQ